MTDKNIYEIAVPFEKFDDVYSNDNFIPQYLIVNTSKIKYKIIKIPIPAKITVIDSYDNMTDKVFNPRILIYEFYKYYSKSELCSFDNAIFKLNNNDK